MAITEQKNKQQTDGKKKAGRPKKPLSYGEMLKKYRKPEKKKKGKSDGEKS